MVVSRVLQSSQNFSPPRARRAGLLFSGEMSSKLAQASKFSSQLRNLLAVLASSPVCSVSNSLTHALIFARVFEAILEMFLVSSPLWVEKLLLALLLVLGSPPV